MAAGDSAWKVGAHGPIVKLAENLWWVEGALPGTTIPRAMTVAKRADGRLVIHSAIAMGDASMRELEAFGEPAFLVVPSRLHRLDAPRFKARYPAIRVLAPKGSRAKVAEKVAVEGTYEDYPPDTDVRVEPLQGIRDVEGVMLVSSKDGATVVLNDTVFNLPTKPRDPVGWLMTTLFASAPGPRVSRVVKLAMIADKKALRGELERLAAIPDLQRLIVAHGAVATGRDAASALRTAAAAL
jgi:hypothetical protein